MAKQSPGARDFNIRMSVDPESELQLDSKAGKIWGLLSISSGVGMYRALTAYAEHMPDTW